MGPLFCPAQNARGSFCRVRTSKGTVLENAGPVGRHCGDLPAVSGELLTLLRWQQNVRTPVLTQSAFSRILDRFAFATHKFSVVLQKFQGKRKFVMAPVLIAKCNLSWVA